MWARTPREGKMEYMLAFIGFITLFFVSWFFIPRAVLTSIVATIIIENKWIGPNDTSIVPFCFLLLLGVIFGLSLDIVIDFSIYKKLFFKK